MILLDAIPHNVMEGTISVTDLIMIITGVLSVAKLYYNQIQNSKTTETRIEALELLDKTTTDTHEAKFEAIDNALEKKKDTTKAMFGDAKNSRNEIRTDFKEAHKELETMMHERINIVKEEVKEDRKENQVEFKAIGETLAGLKADTNAILRALQIK